MAKVFLNLKLVELIIDKQFTIAAFNLKNEAFIVYIALIY